MTPYTPVKDALTPLKTRLKIAKKHGWGESVRAIEQLIENVSNETF